MADLEWEPAAKERLAKVPFFVRPFVKRRAEQMARWRGDKLVTAALLDELKKAEHKG